MAHNHDHNHDERELITLVDEQGNETLFEILLTIDGKEEFGKNYVRKSWNIQWMFLAQLLKILEVK